MKEILETIILNLVDNKDAVNITETQTDNFIKLQVKVSSEDMGKVIGKQGKIANAIRTIMKSFAVRENKKISIDFMD